MLVAVDARLQACVANAVFAANPTPAEQEMLRVIRSRAAVVTVVCIGLMLRCACAVLPSALLRVHVAGLRPREAGSRDSAMDAVVPAICRVYAKSPLLRFGPIVLWLIGTLCQMLVLFDRFEAGSTHEWLACAAVALSLPVIVFISASLNAKTVRELLKQFEALYVLAYALGMASLCLVLFRERPAKMIAIALAIPSFLLSGFQDACAEGGRLLNSRVFFVLNVAALLTYLALLALKLGAYTDYTFKVGTFLFVASLMVCNTITTLLVFGVKNIVFSFYEPGSLFVLTSAVCCVFVDSDALAVLKGAYSLLGQSFGKYARNKTIETYLKKQRLSIVEFRRGARGRMLAGNVMVPALEEEPTSLEDDVSGLGSGAHLSVEAFGLHRGRREPIDSHTTGGEPGAAGSGFGRSPRDMPANPSHPSTNAPLPFPRSFTAMLTCVLMWRIA
jgi:hypothetical protein